MPTTPMKNEKKAILGGTFDPVHIGHINLFHSVNEYTDITTLYVIPAYVSNYKRDKKSAPFSDRMAMLNLAVIDYTDIYPLDDLNIVVSDIEGRKKGISYTSDTVKLLYDELEDDGKVNFIIGDDLVAGLRGWHDFEYLKRFVRFFCFVRYEEEFQDLADVEIHYIKSEKTVSSSTNVREGNYSLLTDSVREYIEENGLYRAER